jgi:N-acylneuraminate cytidylyltransferase
MEAFKLWDDELDMLVSVKESKSNPYFNLFELNAQGYLGKSKYSAFTRRQDVPQVYEYNGAIYIIKTSSIIEKSFSELSKVKPYLMNSRDSVDIDTPLDYELCKLISEKKL